MTPRGHARPVGMSHTWLHQVTHLAAMQCIAAKGVANCSTPLSAVLASDVVYCCICYTCLDH